MPVLKNKIISNSLEPISIYVHWPFCLSKCPYCDFNSHVRENIDEQAMTDALLIELDYFYGLVGKRDVRSIFFGGGTPSLMSASTVSSLLDRVAKLWNVSSQVEITLEANPTSVEAQKFADFSSAGINRVSLGIQALNDTDLKALGREHSCEEALAAIALAQKYFQRSNFDLIYARMNQNCAQWEKELLQAIDMAAGHLSLYQLTMEKGTAFYSSWRQGDLILPTEDEAADMYQLTNDLCAQHDIHLYEVSNYAKKGEESRHNLTYWTYSDYIGVGAGAHGRISYDGKTYATEQYKKPETWLKSVQFNGHATKLMKHLDQKTMAEEMIMMGLRLADGINLKAFEKKIGRPFHDFIAVERMNHLKAEGFVEFSEVDPIQAEFSDPSTTSEYFRLTRKGLPLLNQVLGQILA